MDKEEEVTRRIELLRRKNERLMQRHKEVEADRMSAEKSGQSFSHTERSSPYESPRGAVDRENNQRNSHHVRAHMDEPEEQEYRDNYRNRRNTPRGRGAGNNYYRGAPRGGNRQANFRGGGDQGHAHGRGRGTRRSQDYETKRQENFRLMEEELAQTPGENEDQTTTGVSRFLDDPRRRGDLDPEERWKSTRHKGSYGGLHFDNLKTTSRGRGRGYRGNRAGRGRGMSKLQMSAEYTGRERQDQEKWQAMREAADREIMARSKNSEGKWRREWDAEKVEAAESGEYNDTGRSERHAEPRRNFRGGGRGKRGSGRGRRGSRSNQEIAEKEAPAEDSTASIDHITESTDPELPHANKEENKVASEESPTLEASTSGKPQRVRGKPGKSPKHLTQQRAQTPSSKDGTEVWAQNSHHSDETGAEWKNGAARSVEQWLPSSEGNRNPAIDERMLEQQEDGATVYSQHLGRGWGSEKNIKATKAWVIDTEKAGATNQSPEVQVARHDEDITKTDGSGEAVVSRIQQVKDERTGARSASPRLKHKNLGLSVEIGKGGRRVKTLSEGDSIQVPIGAEHSGTSKNSAENHSSLAAAPTSPLSPDFLKTPEGIKHVTDWAAEMDLQSPTYEARQLQLEKELEKQTVTANVEKSDDVLDEVTKPDATTDTSKIKEAGGNSDMEKDASATIQTKSDDKHEQLSENNVESSTSLPIIMTEDNAEASKDCIKVPDTESPSSVPLLNEKSLENDDRGAGAKESDGNGGFGDSKYKDASEEIEDEFYECEGDKDQTEDKLTSESQTTEDSLEKTHMSKSDAAATGEVSLAPKPMDSSSITATATESETSHAAADASTADSTSC